MTALTARLPNSAHQEIKGLAERDQISVNQFSASATAESLTSVLTLDYLKAEAAKGRRRDFEHYMGKVPDAPAQDGDERGCGTRCVTRGWKPRWANHRRRCIGGAL